VCVFDSDYLFSLFFLANLAFGAVTRGSKLTRSLTIQNEGDVSAQFKWDTKNLPPDFSLSPVSGFVRFWFFFCKISVF
jgi:hypothetical protein